MNYKTINNQSGSVLAISLVLLTAITLLAAMNMQRSSLQTRITANTLHKEQNFNNALNFQKVWFTILSTISTGDPILSAPLRSFNGVNADGSRNYTPVLLDPLIAQPIALTNNEFLENQLIAVSATQGINALAQGQESGNRVTYKYQLWSQARMNSRTQGRSATEFQVTGVSFPGLNTSKNSLYSAP
jgi:hypothetical protein|tara:strand:+ start:2623 stop:3183 length:561 start_codon:yes stop_codon:yes gene_type:complete